MASNIWHAGLICVSPASWPDCGKVRSSWMRSGGGIGSSVKHCDITCMAGSSNRPFDSTPPEPQSPVVPSHVTQRTAQPTAGFRLKAMDWAAMGGEFAGALAQPARRGLGGSDDRGALAGRGSGIVVVEEDGFEALAHVPFDMAGEHAQEDMGAHPRRQPVMDRAEVQVDGLQAAKGALDAGEALIRANHVIGGQDVILDAGADDIKAVEPSLVGDAGRVAAKGETVFGNGDVEQLGELVAVFDTTNGTRDLVLTGGAAAAGDLVGQLAQRRLGGLQQILALAGPFLGQERVLAGVEQGADLRGSERGDPVEPGRPQLVADAGAGDHAAVADQHDARQAKALFELVDLHRQCHRVGGIALEHFDRYRTAIGRTQQTVDDLQLALLAVTGIAKARQLAAPSLDPRRGEVIENERPLFEMAAGEPGRDRGLARTEPVEGAVELDLVDRAEPEQPAQARAGGVGGEITRGC